MPMAPKVESIDAGGAAGVPQRGGMLGSSLHVEDAELKQHGCPNCAARLPACVIDYISIKQSSKHKPHTNLTEGMG